MECCTLPYLTPILFLVASNVFMTFAWLVIAAVLIVPRKAEG